MVAGLTSTALSHVRCVERLRKLLEPAVVVEAAVEDRGIGPEGDFDAARGHRSRAERRNRPAGVIVRVGRAVFAITPS